MKCNKYKTVRMSQLVIGDDDLAYIATLSNDERKKIESLAHPETDNNSKLMEGLHFVLQLHKDVERPTDAPSLVLREGLLQEALDWIKDKTVTDIMNIYNRLDY